MRTISTLWSSWGPSPQWGHIVNALFGSLWLALWLSLAPSGSLRLSLSSNLLTKSLLGSQDPFYRSGCCCISFPSRSKMDPNRLEEEAAQGNQRAVEAYRQVAIHNIPHVNSCFSCDVDDVFCAGTISIWHRLLIYSSQILDDMSWKKSSWCFPLQRLPCPNCKGERVFFRLTGATSNHTIRRIFVWYVQHGSELFVTFKLKTQIRIQEYAEDIRWSRWTRK